MPAVSWTDVSLLKSCRTFLLGYKDGYLKHRENGGTAAKFMPRVYNEYFEVYHWSIPDNKEPDEHVNEAKPLPSDEEGTEKKCKAIATKENVSLLTFTAPMSETWELKYLNSKLRLGANMPLLERPNVLPHQPQKLPKWTHLH